MGFSTVAATAIIGVSLLVAIEVMVGTTFPTFENVHDSYDKMRDRSMIKDITSAIENKHKVKVDVSYDMQPVNADGVLELLEVLSSDVESDWAASGDTWVIQTENRIHILLLKRGVELEFSRSSNQKVNQE